MGLLDTCKEQFGSSNLYEVLNIDKACSADDIKRAYRKLSLKVHPDRVVEAEKEEATEKFKVLGKVHAVLSDKEKRACYDETGCVDEEDSTDLQERDWYEYWRLLFKNITTTDIDEYEEKYKGSQDELDDLIKAFNDSKGSMDLILEYVPYSNALEEPRLRSILNDLIDRGKLEPFPDFINETPRKQQIRKRKYEQEAKKAEKESKKLKKDVDANEISLLTLMQMKKNREKQSDAFFKHLEEKYSKPQKTRSKKTK